MLAIGPLQNGVTSLAIGAPVPHLSTGLLGRKLQIADVSFNPRTSQHHRG